MNHLPLVCLLLVAPGLAQEAATPIEGHSDHGEAFNEGPRQAAYLMPNPSGVHFPVTCASAEAQRFFDQGVGHLHGFWYFEAERTFRHLAALDPDCAMAYWGMAMANVDNGPRAAEFARVAWLKRGLADERERLYIDSLARFHEVEGPEQPTRLGELDEAQAKQEDEARTERRKDRALRLASDYEGIVWEYPDDIEAKAFLVNRLWLNRRFGIPTSSRQANEALLQQIFAVQPNHPAHHYRIHLWDADDSAPRVVDSAVASGPSNPRVAHMWHMGGHIFARLGRHNDAAWQQEASARVDHAHMIRDWVLPDQIFNFAHNNEWFTRSLRHHGRVREALALAKNMIELPRHPKYNRLDKRGCSAAHGRRRLLETLELFELWQPMISLSETMYLEPSDDPEDQAERAYRLGKAHAYLDHPGGVRTQVQALEELLVQGKLARVEALELAEEDALAEGLTDEEVHEAMGAALEQHQLKLDGLRDKLDALDALEVALSGGDMEYSLEVLEQRGFDPTHLSRLCLAAGLDEEALRLARAATEGKIGQIAFHGNLAWILWQTGAREEALEVFDELRGWSALADIDLPVFERLAPLAAARGLPADWRPAYELPADIPERPDLDSLGPLRWTPATAPGWSCPDGLGGEVALADYRGRPVLVIFFLGFGCVHCVEQLQAFGPAAEAYREAGIEIVAIGTDSQEELAESQEDDPQGHAYPFPVLSNSDLSLFKRYRAYDDFEHMPLHGTFLVDGAGRMRWLDISYEPFMDWQFLLDESVRLLGLPDPEGGAADAASAGFAGQR
jgi:peroxiredoxin